MTIVTVFRRVISQQPDANDRTLGRAVPDGHRTDFSPGFDAGRGRAPLAHSILSWLSLLP